MANNNNNNLLKELEMKCANAFKVKKAVIIKAAVALGNYKVGDKTLNDGLLRLGSYDEDDVTFDGDIDDIVTFKGDFAITACSRTFDNKGQIGLIIRDDREGKHTSKNLLFNGDNDVSKFLHYLNDNLKLAIDKEIAEFDSAIKAAYKCKKVAITKLAMAVANYKTNEGEVIGDNLLLMTSYDDSMVTAIGPIDDLFKFKGDFVVTACQRSVNSQGMASLIIRDDRADKHRSKQLLFNGDNEVISFIKFLEDALDTKL